MKIYIYTPAIVVLGLCGIANAMLDILAAEVRCISDMGNADILPCDTRREDCKILGLFRREVGNAVLPWNMLQMGAWHFRTTALVHAGFTTRRLHRKRSVQTLRGRCRGPGSVRYGTNPMRHWDTAHVVATEASSWAKSDIRAPSSCCWERNGRSSHQRHNTCRGARCRIVYVLSSFLSCTMF